jgi:hypothetical protein
LNKVKAFLKLILIIFQDKSGQLDIKIPKHEIEAIARCLLPDIIAFFESEEGRKEFEEWKRQQESNKANSQAKGA